MIEAIIRASTNADVHAQVILLMIAVQAIAVGGIAQKRPRLCMTVATMVVQLLAAVLWLART